MRLEYDLGSQIAPEAIADIPAEAWGVIMQNRSDGIHTYVSTEPELFTEKVEADAAAELLGNAVNEEATIQGDYWHEYDSPFYAVRKLRLGAKEVFIHSAGTLVSRSVEVIEIK